MPAEKRNLIEFGDDIAVRQPGSHDGEGWTLAASFFASVPGWDIVCRRRALHPGATIGWHENNKDEVYYIISGDGELRTEDGVRPVTAGTAMLTRSGGWHELRQVGDEDLVVFIVYRKPATDL